MKPLYYVFSVSFQSCADPNQWIERYTISYPNTSKESDRELAAHLAAKCLSPTETGVRVCFLGLQSTEDSSITPLNPFTLTIVRDAQP